MCSIQIVSCYIHTCAGDEINITTFYNKLSSLVRPVPKHKVLIIREDMDAQIEKREIISFACVYHQAEMENINQMRRFSRLVEERII